jgi:urease accessory protein
VNPSLVLTRLLQLASPALPVGAYSYSQGLEAAVEAGTVRDAASAQTWIGDALRFSMARLEAPLWRRLYAAWSAGDLEEVRELNDVFLCTRETAELRAETLQMGWSLRSLLLELDGFEAAALEQLKAPEEISFPAAFSFAASHWRIPERDALTAYVWSWLENQVMAAVKAVPLGQTQGQRLLAALGPKLVLISGDDSAVLADKMNNYCHGLAIASSVHETQYSRLFRS